jgi:phenylalanine-4-hydroxylase
MMSLPDHLRRYVVEQDYSRYTPIDQELWRYIMRQLRAFLSVHAHPCYLEGLAKTGIDTERIPEISKMSEKLEKFGWRAVPVSGFIPPAAFMELQSLGFLPIASDMRTVSHLMYTPAPDIVHEAAGHAPILIDPEFAGYLKAYASVARKAIISREDMDQYEAIRVLSDTKEDPHSTPEQIRAADESLHEVTKAISHVSEAALLGRMNWWTAEYGLIGGLNDPKIFGAGLLSSVGEARGCLDEKVKKIPLSIDCINFSYDITEPQPQLFVASDFAKLVDVLEELAAQMAFRRGGAEGLEKARKAATVNTIELNSGIQISGRLKNFLKDGDTPVYLQFEGPTQLCSGGRELTGHGRTYHAEGFGSPVGFVDGASGKCLARMSDEELARLDLRKGAKANLKFLSGVSVGGEVKSLTRDSQGRLILIAFDACTVRRGDQTLFQPAWGTFDMAVGSSVTSVFGGPSDRLKYGSTDDFAAKLIPRKTWSPLMQHKHRLYQELRELREGIESGRVAKDAKTSDRADQLLLKVESDFPHDWLLRLGLFELGKSLPSSAWLPRVELELKNLSESDTEAALSIGDGLKLL